MTIQRRRENRMKPVVDTEIAIYLRGVRLEGTVLDVTDGGLGALLPGTCEFKVGQKVHAMYRRQRRLAKVVRVFSTEAGIQLGLKFA